MLTTIDSAWGKMTVRRIVPALAVIALLVAAVATARPSTSEAASTPKTLVGGNISVNTTWDTLGSPYEMISNVHVVAGVSLTIKAGVTVYAKGNVTLQVDGALTVNPTGTAAPVTFTCSTTPSCNTLSWGGIQFGEGASNTSTLNYANISDAQVGVLDFPGASLAHDTFSSGGIGVEYDTVPAQAVTLSSDTFQNLSDGVSDHAGGTLNLLSDKFLGPTTSSTAAIDFDSGTLNLTGTTIDGFGYGVSAASSTVDVQSSTIDQGVAGVTPTATGILLDSPSTLTIDHSVIQHDVYAVDAIQNPTSISVTNSVVYADTTGFYLDVENNNIHLNHNDIYGNGTNINIVSGKAGSTVDATNDWWATTTASTISATIIDCNDHAGLPCVNFQPFLTSPPVTPPGPVPPQPTATPTVTPTPVAQLLVNPTLQNAGQSVIVTGGGYNSGETVTVAVLINLVGGGTQNQVATTTAFSNGTFIASLALPDSAATGSYQVTAVGSTSHRSAQVTLAVSALPAVSTPTSTPTATPTSTSSPTLEPTKTPKPYVLKFRSLSVKHSSVHVGKTERIKVQANHSQRLSISVRVVFPRGHALVFTSKTNSKGYWAKTFTVPKGSISSKSREVVVIVDLKHGSVTKQRTITFSLSK